MEGKENKDKEKDKEKESVIPSVPNDPASTKPITQSQDPPRAGPVSVVEHTMVKTRKSSFKSGAGVEIKRKKKDKDPMEDKRLSLDTLKPASGPPVPLTASGKRSNSPGRTESVPARRKSPITARPLRKSAHLGSREDRALHSPTTSPRDGDSYEEDSTQKSERSYSQKPDRSSATPSRLERRSLVLPIITTEGEESSGSLTTESRDGLFGVPGGDITNWDDTNVEKLVEELKSARKRIIELEVMVKARDAEITKLKGKLQMKEATTSRGRTEAKSKPDEKRKSAFDIELSAMVRKKATGLSKKVDLDHREKIVLEILSTEQSFVSSLQILLNVYIKQLNNMAKENKISIDDIKIFEAVEQLLIANTKLLDQLEERLDQWVNEPEKDMLGDIFKEWAPNIKFYCRYAKYYEESTIQMELKKQNNTTFKQALAELDQEATSLNCLSLRDYLIMPVQRVPRYCLLVKDLLKNTPNTHRDYVPLEEALLKIEDLANQVNENIRRASNEANMMKILEKGGGFERLLKVPKPVGPRFYEKDGEVTYLIDICDQKKGLKHKSKPELYVFNDILVAGNFLSKKSAPQEWHIPTKIMWVTNKPDLIENYKHKIEDTSTYNLSSIQNCILITGPESMWLLGNDTPSMRNAWMETFKKVMDAPGREQMQSGMRTGSYEFKTKGVYEGTWLNNWMHGKGKLTRPDRSVLEGYWDSRRKGGFGMVISPTEPTVNTGWKEINEKIEVVDVAELFSQQDLSDRDWQLLSTGAQILTLKGDDRFVEQGKPISKLYRVRAGKIRFERTIKKSGKKIVLSIGDVGTVVGDISVFEPLSESWSDVVAHTDGTELEVIALPILFGLLKSDPLLSMRFFRQIARKLSSQIKQLHGPKSDGAGSEKREGQEKEESDNRKADSSTDEEWNKIFHLPPNEYFIKMADCTKVKSVFQGKIVLFREHVCYYSSVFGRTKSKVIALGKIKSIQYDSKKGVLSIDEKGKKSQYELDERESFVQLLISVWEEKKSKLEKATSEGHTMKGIKKNTPKKPAVVHNDENITMTKQDWNLVLAGASFVSYKDGQAIIEEGQQQNKIFQLASGRCTITKAIPDNPTPKILGYVQQPLHQHPNNFHLTLFGEMSLLAENLESKASASVVSSSGDCKANVIEVNYIFTLFVEFPSLAGRFYAFLGHVLARRLRDREETIEKEQS